MTFGISAGTYLMAGTALAGGLLGANAAKSGAAAQSDAANRAAELQQQQYEQTRADQAPWREAGGRALGKFESMADYKPFSMNAFTQDPGYAFRLSEGQKALDRSAAARGGLISGGALKAAQRYGQDMGSQEYTNAFNRYQTERTARLGPLQSLVGVGQTSVNQLGQAGQNYASNVGNALMNQSGYAGNAGMVGANAMASGLTGALSSYGRSPVSFNNSYGNSIYNPNTGQGGFSGTSLSNFYTGTGTSGD